MENPQKQGAVRNTHKQATKIGKVHFLYSFRKSSWASGKTLQAAVSMKTHPESYPKILTFGKKKNREKVADASCFPTETDRAPNNHGISYVWVTGSFKDLWWLFDHIPNTKIAFGTFI